MAAVILNLTPKTLVAGVATKLSSLTGTSAIVCSSVFLTADSANTGKVYFGGPTVSTANGKPMDPTDEIQIGYDLVFGCNGKIDLANIYFDTDTTGNAVRITYIRWDSF